ncbi:hypothetical protein AAFF_G00168300 [Aldrovandia affinis]|uniref:Alpha-macroglobulin receptor-binding domain-containing protein n=1 Tax=Aldrovandia affinis TaxID=143900 RepID=A0AAD7RM38_9TELE|nr:hypothetical protein AAFF_G00168300 [Aldrovandia affinis]
MVIISIRILSGFILDKDSLIQLEADSTVMRVDEVKGHVDIYLYGLKKTEKPRWFYLTIEKDVPVKNMKAAVVTIYDYYQKSDNAVSEYTSPCVEGDLE